MLVYAVAVGVHVTQADENFRFCLFSSFLSLNSLHVFYFSFLSFTLNFVIIGDIVAEPSVEPIVILLVAPTKRFLPKKNFFFYVVLLV